jgi:hypothetical protein
MNERCSVWDSGIVFSEEIQCDREDATDRVAIPVWSVIFLRLPKDSGKFENQGSYQSHDKRQLKKSEIQMIFEKTDVYRVLSDSNFARGSSIGKMSDCFRKQPPLSRVDSHFKRATPDRGALQSFEFPPADMSSREFNLLFWAF